MTNQTITELLALGKSAKAYFEHQLGYDDVAFNFVRLATHGDHKLEFTLGDKFQDNLTHDMKYKVGWTMNVPLEGFWDKLTTWPNREQRELTILARKMATIDGNLDEIKSAQVKAFIARMQPDIDSLRAQITHLTGDDGNVVL